MRTPQALWSEFGVRNLLLAPLSAAFALAVGLRRFAYRRGWLASVAVGVPVLVVGNITAGGSGKTPLVIWLVEQLRAQGCRPGVVSRGYGGSVRGSMQVQHDSDPAQVGDEPLSILLRTGAPVVVGRDRVAAARTLLARHPGIDCIVSDDGLQHYRLQRDGEIAVLDAATGFGNGWLLPAGPLRESRSRMQQVDAVVRVHREGAVAVSSLPGWRVDYQAGKVWRLKAPQDVLPLSALPTVEWLAITGIGRPEGFFDMLTQHGIAFRARAFADHHAFSPRELPADSAVLMTEKDAVKCLGFAGDDWWAVMLEVVPSRELTDWLQQWLHAHTVIASAQEEKHVV
ncbi:MAG: tetraacyldisaccharide 4'-kinase [Thiobacillus sp.]